MKNYVIFADGPIDGKAYPGKITKNCCGQIIIFDGPTTKGSVQKVARVAREYFGRIQVFVGKNLGKLTDL